MGVYIPGRRIKVTPRLGLADTALVDSCIPEGLLWYTYQRKFESAPTSARPIVGRQQKVAYETEDFHRVVPRTGSITSLCEAENRDSPYASAVVPRPFTETSSARHPRPRAAWCAGEGAAGRLARRSLLTGLDYVHLNAGVELQVHRISILKIGLKYPASRLLLNSRF